MDLHHLRVFQAAARTGSFTAAGRELSLSQSTVSLHIKQLEEEFGCRLFIRSKKKIYLSDAGRLLQQGSERVLSEAANMETTVRELSTSASGTIRLGVGASTLNYLLPKSLTSYRRRYPQVEIIVLTGTTEMLLQSLLQHDIDIAIVMPPSPALALVQTIPLMKEELVIVLDRMHPLAVKQQLAPRDLEALNFISHLRGTAMQVLQDAYFENMGVSPRITMEMENIEAIKSLISFGLGAALLPISCLQPMQSRGLVYKKVRDVPMMRQLLIAANDWKSQPRIRRSFIERIRQTLSPGGSR